MKRTNCFFTINLFFILTMFFAVNSYGATTVPAGAIVDTIWTVSGSPYSVTGNLTIAGLTIEPGVRVEFTGNYVFEVAGTLTAVGTEAEPILFVRAEGNTTGWQGIYFNQSNNNSSMEHVTVQGSINSGIRILNCLPTISYCAISSNNATKGGGLNIDISSLAADELIITGCTINDNTSTGNGGGVEVNVGASTIQFENCKISNNYSNSEPIVGIYQGGGINYVSTTGQMIMNNCQILNNDTYSAVNATTYNYGGGICASGDLMLFNTIISGNQSRGYNYVNRCYTYGGGVYHSTGVFVARNCIISNNKSISIVNPGFPKSGGIYVTNDTATLTNCTIAYNDPSGFESSTPVTTPVITNSVIYGNTGTQVVGTSTITYSNVQNGFTGEGNITGNPVFKSGTDLMIVNGSPCIDAGNPNSQYNDQCFPYSLGSTRNDMGAHGGPGGCDWAPPENVAYYYIVEKPVVELWQYDLELHAMTWEGVDWILGSSWTISNGSIASLTGNKVTGIQNGHVLVSTTYDNKTYSKTIYFKSSGSFESEANDSAVNANTIAEHAFIEGELLTDDIDYYKLTANQFISAEFAFFSRSLSADVLIEVLDNSQSVIASGTSTNGESIRIHAGLMTGSYYIRLSSAGDIDDDETYDIVYGEVDPALNLVFEAENNNTLINANDLVIDETVEGRLVTNNDQDFYRVLINAPVYTDLVFHCPGIDSTKQFVINVYNSSEANLINSFTVSEGSPVELPMGLNIAEYFIKVSGVEGFTETTLPYTLSLKTSSHPDIEIESNNTIPFANPIAKDQAKTGIIYSSGDVDLYGFEAIQTGTIHVDFTPTTITGDYKISILDKNGNEKYNKTSVDGNARTLHYGIESPDYYYIRVETMEGGNVDSSSYYELTLTSDINIQPIVGLVSISIEAPKDHIAVSEQVQLTLRKHFSDTSSQLLENGTLISLKPSVATVNSNGVVTGISNGNVTIVGVYEGFTTKIDLTVGLGETATQHHGNLIIVAGSGASESDPLNEGAQYLSDLTYKRFQNRLFQNEDIYYLNPVSYHDLDGDGYDNNVVDDATPTVTEFGQAITTWAVNQSTDGPLFIYLVGHGETDTFSFPSGTLTATQLRGYIDTFRIATSRRVVVIMEACKSGTFADNLVTSGNNTIVVTSSDNNDSYLKMGGKISFSQFLMDSLRKGDSVWESVLDAKDKLGDMEAPFNTMNPQLVEGVALSSDYTWVGGDFVVANLLPGWIIGKVFKYNTDTPIANALVNITVNGTTSHWDVNTMDDGYYLCEVPAGTYNINLNVSGYDPINFSNISVGLAEIITKNFGLVSNADTDGDNVNDDIDAFPNNPNEWLDHDSDGTGDNADTDDDNDGMPDTWEDQYDLDPLFNDAADDFDEDGYSNLKEYQRRTDPLDKDSFPVKPKSMPWLPFLLE